MHVVIIISVFKRYNLRRRNTAVFLRRLYYRDFASRLAG